MNNKKKYLSLLAFSCVSFALIVVIWKTYEKDKPTNPVKGETVRISLARGILTIPPLIAREKKFFEDEGLTVSYTKDCTSGKESFDEMLAGNADIATVATTPVVINSFSRNDMRIFATYTTTYEGIKIITRKDRTIQKPEDLRGKRIGYVGGTISQFTLYSVLANNKILFNEIKGVSHSGPILLSSLVDGTIDALVIWEPFANRAMRTLDNNGTYVSTDRVYRMAINFAAMKNFIDGNPEIIVKVIKALDRAITFINSDPDEAKNLCFTLLDIDPVIIESIWNEYTHALTLDQLLLITMEAEAHWLIRSGITAETRVPNYLNFIHYQSLEQIRPNAVSIIR
ncbi:MAG TPA: NrtA/SsuA/CpmA family ABC transporter substrate-binding protein [Spirochaetota bacterium]|nr:NrtA/SsuA/CpmA family ABC transporter substrate-binding protein [Spirochaetota bacterium]HPI90647.1 NrtA/SsuA/CpmA family ABC transporter substrate-binding protein [Spirochaetota bacterium]HPR49701.1 NrtA/SsuA/CpmA family ABC transporter substrate-binding protein [Spirochaetota bacterium]